MIALKNLPLAKTQLVPIISILLFTIIIFIFDESLMELLAYHRSEAFNGHYWQVFTAHFLHTNIIHLALNGVALVLLWSLHGHFYTWQNYTFLFSFCALFTSISIYFFSPDITQYVGLSGVLHGVFVWGAIKDIVNKEKTGYLLLIGVLLKVIHEQVVGPSDDLAELIAANVAVDSHLYGLIAGLLAATFTWLFKK